ncbi:MAG: 2Fe-2S iron-sulfur cluster-binding protein, partial [Mycobacterium sp.]
MQESGALSHISAATATDAHSAGIDRAAVPEGFVPLRVKRVVRETRDAISIILDVPESSVRHFGYRAGQFLTLLVCVDGREHRRCYSMSSAPAAGEDLRITVKRDRDGVVSNWLNDTAVPGNEIHALPPQGRFVLKDTDRELVAFAGGSGITPVFSLLRSALMSSTRDTRLFYANRGRDSVIFDKPLASLEDVHAGRFVLHHHLDDESGVVTSAHVESFVAHAQDAGDAEYYICGPGPFMDIVQTTLRTAGVPADRVHLEHFEVAEMPVGPPAGGGDTVTEEVTIELERRRITVPYSHGDSLLQTARMAGLRAPSSCEIGSCGTCMARLTQGSARMINNDALEDVEVNDGWVLTCQAL